MKSMALLGLFMKIEKQGCTVVWDGDREKYER